MLIRHSKKPLPKCWLGLRGANKAVFQGDVKVCEKGRLKAKLLIFKSSNDLRNFWKLGLGKGDLGKGCVGAVNSLGYEIIHFPAKDQKQLPQRVQVDKNFFCVIGLTLEHIGMEVITHESVHVGFSYAKRVNNKNLWPNAVNMDEENVCYPAGRIAANINILFRKNGIYDLCEKFQEKQSSKNTKKNKSLIKSKNGINRPRVKESKV